MDDKTVAPISKDDVMKSNAYMLFYQRRDPRPLTLGPPREPAASSVAAAAAAAPPTVSEPHFKHGNVKCGKGGNLRWSRSHHSFSLAVFHGQPPNKPSARPRHQPQHPRLILTPSAISGSLRYEPRHAFCRNPLTWNHTCLCKLEDFRPADAGTGAAAVGGVRESQSGGSGGAGAGRYLACHQRAPKLCWWMWLLWRSRNAQPLLALLRCQVTRAPPQITFHSSLQTLVRMPEEAARRKQLAEQRNLEERRRKLLEDQVRTLFLLSFSWCWESRKYP